MIYPIYHHQSVLNDICDTLGYDINTIINKDFNHSTKVYTLGKYDFPYILFVGLGDVSELTTARLRKLVLNISKNINEPVQLMTDHLDEGIDKHAFVRIWVESHIIAHWILYHQDMLKRILKQEESMEKASTMPEDLPIHHPI